MFKQKINRLSSSARLAGAAFLGLVVVGGGLVSADRFDAQIQVLQQQNASSQAASNNLAAQASSYQDAINKLDQQIGALQQSIVDNQLKSQDLQKQIDQAEADLAQQKKVLGENIKSMYIDGQVTTLEILANSTNLSDFVNQQEYQSTVQNKVKATLDRINALKAQLADQKRQLDLAIADLTKQQNELSSTQAQQSQMLAYTEGQKAAFDQQIKTNQSQISDLRRQQIIENSRGILSGMQSGVMGGGGYPGAWAYAAQDSIVDSWGMYNRECVSYTAWKVAVSGRYMPYWGGIGNANQWPGNARAAGIPMDYGGNAQVGDVAISTAGFYGHAMYVEAVNGDGTVTVSQYNQFLDGTYSVNSRSASNLYFIHF